MDFSQLEEKQENAVHYSIHVDDVQTPESLHELCVAVMEIVWAFVDDYLWHQDPFVLSVDVAGNRLVGKTRFGDNIEDEWFIVSLLFAISERLPSTFCQVTDNDGDFLLIEAGDVVDGWMQPDTTANRVFIHEGRVVVVPPFPQNPGQLSAFFPVSAASTACGQESGGVPPLCAADAVRVLRSGADFVAPRVTKCIRSRIGGYPAKGLSHDFCKHTVECIVPVHVAYCLSECKHLVGRAVRAFYERDPLTLKKCQAMQRFHPDKGLVHCMVEFTRCMYAMALQQQFPAPPCFQRHMHKDDPRLYRMESLGMKLAVGFEIAFQTDQEQLQGDPAAPATHNAVGRAHGGGAPVGSGTDPGTSTSAGIASCSHVFCHRPLLRHLPLLLAPCLFLAFALAFAPTP